MKKNTMRWEVELEGLPGPQCKSVGRARMPSLALGVLPAYALHILGSWSNSPKACVSLRSKS